MSFSALIARLRGSGSGPEMGAEGPPTNNADAPPADGIIQLSPVRRQGPARRQVPGAGGALQGAPRQGQDNRGMLSPAPDPPLPLGVDPACLVAEGLKMQMFDQQKFKKVLGDGPEPSHPPKTSTGRKPATHPSWFQLWPPHRWDFIGHVSGVGQWMQLEGLESSHGGRLIYCL